MRTLNDIITISTQTSTTDVNGDVSVTWSTPVTVRADVIQTDGARYLKEEELSDRVVYRMILFDNNYSNNIKIVYNGLTLYPVIPITKNQGKSLLSEIVIIAATKV